MPSTTIQYFEYKHLPMAIRPVSAAVHHLAHIMENCLPDGAEKSAGMRKLLEAKDCFVRAAMAEPKIELKTPEEMTAEYNRVIFGATGSAG